MPTPAMAALRSRLVLNVSFRTCRRLPNPNMVVPPLIQVPLRLGYPLKLGELRARTVIPITTEITITGEIPPAFPGRS
jgi:hypothetical protein